jgi:tetratricopeptide (TPR) repeat protein
MRTRSLILIALAAAALTSCSTGLPRASTLAMPGADREIDAAIQLIDKAPESAAGYNQLAVLYMKRGRETGDPAFADKAQAAVERALEISPGDNSALKLQATLHLTSHRFAEALELGKKLLEDQPDDAFAYGIITDAQAELGNYPEAVAAAQRMVDLKPNSNSFARVAYLRSRHGDHAGSVEMYKMAARTADPQDKEAQSWCLTQLGEEFWRNGRYDEAAKAFDEALRVFPRYYLAQIGKGRLLASLGDLSAATAVLTEASDQFRSTDALILLGDAYAAQGQIEKARGQYDLVQNGEQSLGELHDAHRLALFWADHDTNLDEALRIAREDHKELKDIYAADILAWCLYKKGQFSEAKKIIAEAMRLKTRDARIYYHAGMIELALGNRTAAKRLLREAIGLNPGFDIRKAPHAKKTLEELG